MLAHLAHRLPEAEHRKRERDRGRQPAESGADEVVNITRHLIERGPPGARAYECQYTAEQNREYGPGNVPAPSCGRTL